MIRTFKTCNQGIWYRRVTDQLRTEQDISMKAIVLGGSLVIAVLIWLLPEIPVSFLGALIVVVFGFFFATVSSRMVGIVGSSNNPVSGMAIATLIVYNIYLKGYRQHRCNRYGISYFNRYSYLYRSSYGW